MSEDTTPLDVRLEAAWNEMAAIKDRPDFDDLMEGIEADVLFGLNGDDRTAAIEALNAYGVQLGRGSKEGYV